MKTVTVIAAILISHFAMARAAAATEESNMATGASGLGASEFACTALCATSHHALFGSKYEGVQVSSMEKDPDEAASQLAAQCQSQKNNLGLATQDGASLIKGAASLADACVEVLNPNEPTRCSAICATTKSVSLGKTTYSGQEIISLGNSFAEAWKDLHENCRQLKGKYGLYLQNHGSRIITAEEACVIDRDKSDKQ